MGSEMRNPWDHKPYYINHLLGYMKFCPQKYKLSSRTKWGIPRVQQEIVIWLGVQNCMGTRN